MAPLSIGIDLRLAGLGTNTGGGSGPVVNYGNLTINGVVITLNSQAITLSKVS